MAEVEVQAVKKNIPSLFVAIILASPLLAGNFPAQQAYSPSQMKVLGVLDSGQTSALVEYSRPGPYRAFVFEGNGHDRVDITVTGAEGRAFIALADDTLTPIASGIGHLDVALPYHGPDTETFYVLVKPTTPGVARFNVHLTKIGTVQPTPASLTGRR
jgi:hypothetical protein